MNAIAIHNAKSPAAFRGPSPVQARRRRRIGDFGLAQGAMDRFNRLLTRLDSRHAPLDRDSIASAARDLQKDTAASGPPARLRQMMGRATTLACMQADPGWTLADGTDQVVALVLDYLQRQDDLIPDTLPVVGRLDDAIVVETAWPRLEAEVADYLDFCRLREVEAGLRGCGVAAFSFTRDDWGEARRSEAALARHQRQVRETSYLPEPVPLLRVH